MVPAFTDDDVLPIGEYFLTLTELMTSSLVLGSRQGGDWDVDWRQALVNNLARMVRDLSRVGVSEVFIDGSFVENKPHPNDIDGYFVCERSFYLSGDLESQLQQHDSIWTWDTDRRYAVPPGSKRQLPMWHKYRVELFPHVGQFTGILDAFGNELMFPSAFRQTRDFLPKGIVKIGGLS